MAVRQKHMTEISHWYCEWFQFCKKKKVKPPEFSFYRAMHTQRDMCCVWCNMFVCHTDALCLNNRAHNQAISTGL